MPIPKRSEIRPGVLVQIVEKHNQRTGKITEGIVARILTSSSTHPHGIKVMLKDGKVGRVKAILDLAQAQENTECLIPPTPRAPKNSSAL